MKAKANLIFVMIGTHENFYRDLKKYKKECNYSGRHKGAKAQRHKEK